MSEKVPFHKEYSWIKDGINYWDNEDCPRSYLEKSLVMLVDDVEGVEVDSDHFNELPREELIRKIDFYEYVLDK